MTATATAVSPLAISDDDINRVNHPKREIPEPTRIYILDIPGRGRKLRLKVSGTEPLWMKPIFFKIAELLSLPKNWDSYGADPIDFATADFTLRLLISIMKESLPIPTIVPANHGGLQFEWHKGGIDFEVEVFSQDHLKFFFLERQSNQQFERELTQDLTLLQTVLDQVSERLSVKNTNRV